MSDPRPPLAHERLLEHQAFLRRLARSLVADPHRAEDLAQEVSVIALENPPRVPGPMRAWLARVLRNLVSNTAKSEGRRSDRERESSPQVPARTPAELEEHFQLQRRVMDAVERLEEPYRRVILMRYYEDLGPSAIAAQLGVPVATVKTRLARGLARLRSDLDENHRGDRSAWVLLLASGLDEAEGTATAAALTTGGLAMGVKLAIAVSVVGGGALLGTWWTLRAVPSATEPSALAAPAAVSEAVESILERPPLRNPAVQEARASSVEGVALANPDSQTQPIPDWELVVELHGWSEEDEEPLAISVHLDPSEAPAISIQRELAEQVTLDVGALFTGVNVRPFKFTTKLDHPRYLPAEVEVLVPEEIVRFAVDVARLPTQIQLVRAKGTVTGTVVAPHAVPRDKIRVAIFAMESDPQTGSPRPARRPTELVRPESNGGFRLRADDAAEHVVVAFLNYEPMEEQFPTRPDSRVMAIEKDGVHELAPLVLDDGAAIEGRVVLLGAEKPPTGRILATLLGGQQPTFGNLSWLDGRFENSQVRVRWTESGGFRVPGLAPRIHVLSPHGWQVQSEWPTITLGAVSSLQVEFAAPATEVELILQRTRVNFVVTAEGVRIPGASVWVYEGNGWHGTRTGSEGRFSIALDSREGLPREGLHLKIEDPRFPRKELRLTSEELTRDEWIPIELDGVAVEPATLVVGLVGDSSQALKDTVVGFLLYDMDQMSADELKAALNGLPVIGSQKSYASISPSNEFPKIDTAGSRWILSEFRAGRYHVRVLPRPAEKGARSLVLPEEFEIQLLPGRSAEHSWTPRLGGALRLNFIGADVARYASLLGQDGRPMVRNYRRSDGSNSSMAMIPGVNEVDPPMPAGVYELLIKMLDRSTRTIPIRIEAGRVNDVEVDLSKL